jgi:hypothetical protein
MSTTQNSSADGHFIAGLCSGQNQVRFARGDFTRDQYEISSNVVWGAISLAKKDSFLGHFAGK